jgi:hypothetical protein
MHQRWRIAQFTPMGLSPPRVEHQPGQQSIPKMRLFSTSATVICRRYKPRRVPRERAIKVRHPRNALVERFTDDLGGWGHTALIDGAAPRRGATVTSHRS